MERSALRWKMKPLCTFRPGYRANLPAHVPSRWRLVAEMARGAAKRCNP
jgi:hypothetical protein